MKKQNLQKRKAFSLVELAIVIIIIGLLIAGIMGGASLIKSATLRAVTTEASNYKVAVNAFHTKYNFYPGDYGQNPLYKNDPGGNGDGRISIGKGAVGSDTGNATVVESALAIGHLFTDNSLDASLFKDNNYTASTTYNTDITFSSTASTNDAEAPRGKITNSIWVIANDAEDIHRNVIYLTRSFDTTGTTLSDVLKTGILNYADMLAIDTMADDGKTNDGFVQERAGCTVESTGQACSISFDLEFFSAN